ncbi:MAG: choice-of-anchor J domain-containing protein [Bacteroidales bacterium]|nr:choice-of-anchor J domain-containing protein [Bacteroidales bacterium]
MKKILLSLMLMVCVAGVLRAQMYLNAEFNNSIPYGWQNIDADGDGYKWIAEDGYALSYSYYSKVLTPNNWLISPQIDLTNATAGTDLSYYVATAQQQYPAEHYQVLLSTGSASTADFTNVLYDETLTAANVYFKQRIVSLDSYIGQKVYIAFVHNNCSDNYAIAIAEPKVVGPNEIGLYSLDIPKFETVNNPITVSGAVMNLGSAPMTSFSVSYSVNGGPAVAAETFSGLNVARGDTAHFTHSVTIPTPDVKDLKLKVIITNNDNENDWEEDNEAEMTIAVYDKYTKHRILLEEFVTANCGNCPSAIQQIKNLVQNRDDVCLLAHHNGYGTDGLTHTSSSSLMTFYGGGSYTPAAMIDRKVIEGIIPIFSAFNVTQELLDEVTAEPAFVTVNISDATYDQDTRKLTVTVSGEILRTIEKDAADLRLSLYMKEDNLKTTPGQSGSSLGTNYIHNNVMRASISGVWGDNGIISSNQAGTTYSNTFTYTVPTSFTITNCSLIAFVSRYNSSIIKRDVLNAKGVTISDIIAGNLPANDVVFNGTDGISENTAALFSIYPNPATDYITISSEAEIIEIQIINLEGQLVKSLKGNKKTVSLQGLSKGIYFVKCETEAGTSVKKFIKQ